MTTRSPIGDLVQDVDRWDPSASPGEFVYIDLSSIDRETKAITDPSTLSCADAPSRARQLVRDGDVLVSAVRPNLNAVAHVSSALDGATASTGFTVLRPGDDLHDRYLFHWVRTREFIAEMTRLSTGASYPAVSDRIVKSSTIPQPPVGEQRRIAAVLDAADALRTKRRQALAKLDTLTQAIFIDMFGDPVANPMGWPDGRVLGEIADVRSGITKGRKVRSTDLTTVPYLAVVNVQDGFINLDPLKTIEASAEEISRYGLEGGDILLTEGGDPDKLGRGAVWRGEVASCIHQNHVFRVRIEEDGISPAFLGRLLGSTRGKRYFLRMAKQTTGIASINMTQLRSFPLLEPPFELQQAYLDRLESISSLKARLTGASQQSETLFASLQQRAFRGEL